MERVAQGILSPNPWLKGTSIFMSLMFLFSVGTVISSIATPRIVDAIWPDDWEEVAGPYPENGTADEMHEWQEGEAFWDETRDYWDSIMKSKLFEISAVFGFLLTLISAASVPMLWSGDRDLGLKLSYAWVAIMVLNQLITTIIYYNVGFMPRYSEFGETDSLPWIDLVESVSLAFSLGQILVCNACLVAILIVVSARSKKDEQQYDLSSGFHISER